MVLENSIHEGNNFLNDTIVSGRALTFETNSRIEEVIKEWVNNGPHVCEKGLVEFLPKNPKNGPLSRFAQDNKVMNQVEDQVSSFSPSCPLALGQSLMHPWAFMLRTPLILVKKNSLKVMKIKTL